MKLIAADERARLDDRGRTLLAEPEANRSALLHDMAGFPKNSAAAADRRVALASTDRRIGFLVRDRPAR